MQLDYLAHYGVLGMKWGVRKDRGKRSRGMFSANRYGVKPKALGRKSFEDGIDFTMSQETTYRRAVQDEYRRIDQTENPESKVSRRSVKDRRERIRDNIAWNLTYEDRDSLARSEGQLAAVDDFLSCKTKDEWRQMYEQVVP